MHSPAKDNFSSASSFEAERLGLARRLHETLAQDLASIGYRLDAVIADTISAELRAEIREIRLSVMQVAQSFRDEIYQTRMHTRSELIAFISQHLEDAKFAGDFEYPNLRRDVESRLNEALMEIVRNSIKHAKATRVYLRHQLNEQALIIEIGDDGIGNVAIRKDGFGLFSIDELLKQITSEYHCTSDEKGTHFQISIDRKYLE